MEEDDGDNDDYDKRDYWRQLGLYTEQRDGNTCLESTSSGAVIPNHFNTCSEGSGVDGEGISIPPPPIPPPPTG